MKKIFATALACATFLSAAPALAVTHVGTFTGNDCPAEDAGPGDGFSNCYAFPGGTTIDDLVTGGTPAIYKIGEDGEQDFSDLFPTISGNEFDITYTEEGNIWSFTYTPDADDPIITYFSIKQAGQFALFDNGGAAITSSGDLNLSTYFPNNPGWSHATFFDTGTPAVPEPSTWAMMLFGFGALGFAMRRRRGKGSNETRVRFAF